ncbi:hypothetical protein TcWFU_007163 [Taenia crassiceps]|uniref:Uncharacterized protein n=1 Tax=Taenia crassiceps TaxID=6207 RepID=A0ABR4Q0B2_9CEST
MYTRLPLAHVPPTLAAFQFQPFLANCTFSYFSLLLCHPSHSPHLADSSGLFTIRLVRLQAHFVCGWMSVAFHIPRCAPRDDHTTHTGDRISHFTQQVGHNNSHELPQTKALGPTQSCLSSTQLTPTSTCLSILITCLRHRLHYSFYKVAHIQILLIGTQSTILFLAPSPLCMPRTDKPEASDAAELT